MDRDSGTHFASSPDGKAAEAIRVAVTSGSTTARTEALEQLVQLVTSRPLNEAQLQDVVRILLLTLAYTDGRTRHLALQALEHVLLQSHEQQKSSPSATAHGPPLVAGLLRWLETEAKRAEKGGAASSRFVPLTWACIVYSTWPVGGQRAQNGEWSNLVNSLAALVYCFLDGRHDVKPSLRKAVLTVARRAVRSAPNVVPSLVQLLTSATSSATALRNAPLLGLTMDVVLRLKPKKGVDTSAIMKQVRPAVQTFWAQHVLGAKSLPPKHVMHAFDDFLAATAGDDAAEPSWLATLETSLSQNPEVGIASVEALLSNLPESVLSATHFRGRCIPLVLASTKSAAVATREAATHVGCKLVAGIESASADDVGKLRKFVLDSTCQLLKSGKTASPDHRAALYIILSSVPPSEVTSVEIQTTALAALSKESNEPVVRALLQAVSIHVPYLLAQNVAIGASQTGSLVKAMQETKATTRRAAHAAVGDVFWALSQSPTERTDAAVAFATGVLPGIESALKLLGSNPVNAPSGPLEGYVAIAVLKMRLRLWDIKKIEDMLKANITMKGLLVGGAKPSFLLWDKVYRKATTAEEELWLLRAIESVIIADAATVEKDDALQSSLFQVIAHLILHSSHFETRTAATRTLASLQRTYSNLVHSIVGRGLLDWITQDLSAAKTKPTSEDAPTPVDLAPRFRPILLALAQFEDEVEPTQREELLTRLVVLAHHPRITSGSSAVWVDMLLRAGLAPERVVENRVDELISLVLTNAPADVEVGHQLAPPLAVVSLLTSRLIHHSQAKTLPEAAYAAASSLALINPTTIIPRLFKQLGEDLDPKQLDFIGTTEFGIWSTSEGTTFVDVLAAAKANEKGTAAIKKSKDREIELWEAELREALARKKPQVSTLSKADQRIFEQQLVVEADTRRKMRSALGRVRRGFKLSICLVQSHAELVNEYLASIISEVLSVIASPAASLVAEDAFDTYLLLGRVCSPRLGSFEGALGVAVLRSLDAPVVPESFRAEPLSALVTRVLYRIRFLAEETPFDSATFAYAAPLVNSATRAVDLKSASLESVLEQMTLALDFLAYHARACAGTAFPRLAVINDILSVLSSFPALARAATTTLVDVCEAIRDNASALEIETVLAALRSEETSLRFACLQAVQPLDLTDLVFPANLWVACHDSDHRNRELAVTAWDDNALDVPESFLEILLPLLSHHAATIRTSAAEAVVAALATHPTQLDETIAQLAAEYRDKAKEIVPQYDQFGMIIEESLTAEDPWKTREALGTTLRLAAPLFEPRHVQSFFDLLIDDSALGDRKQAVRSEMLEAAMSVIDFHGAENLQALINRFEEFLRRPSTGDETQDYTFESLVILLGRLARHLDPADTRVKTVVARLVDALKTPSEVVQAAVCDCLSPLARVVSDEVPALVDQLMDELFHAEKYAERRGAAFGLAGFVRGRGISTLREFSILGQLRDNAEDKKSMPARQGAVFAYEILSTVLGRLFEPYVTDILPTLLASFGDTSREVRDATQDAAKAIMSQLSGHAVKLMLPTLLEGLDEKQWRAKKGAIDMIGNMAFLAPRQLSLSLPTILPRLTEVLMDTHKQVREAANSSLMRFGEVVTNPEIQVMTSTLLDALVDPAKKTAKALDALLSTTFAHFIDSSSLSLVVPILERGLRERSADIKRKASAIVGNMATITESQDLIPHLQQLVPLLRGVLIDPVPEARSTAAKSMGALVERLGENNFPDLVESLMAVLKSPSSGVDQQGAAQGLAEVLQACGIDRLEGVLPTILSNTSNPRVYVREGHISLLVFLPATFGERFSPYLGRIIQPVLNGLADDSDYVRDASMRAGRMIVANHSTKAIDLLLPELESGLFDPSWRIRQSSVQLVGELLFRVSGVSGKVDGDEDAEDDVDEPSIGSDAARKALLETLGREKRDRVLSGLYIVRQDSVGVVRQAALHVWKALVSNTPRMVREILSVLMQIIVRILAAPGAEQRATAATTLAETCRKLGEAVIGEVIGILRKAMSSSDRRQREGVCLALTELMANTNRSSLEAHESAIIEAVRNALVDPEPSVRTAAARAFDVAQQVIGTRSIDETIPTLLDALQQPGETADAALAALQEVMQVRAEKIFPVLIPRLIAPPITAFNARALAALVRVAGSALGRRLTQIIDALQHAQGVESDSSTAGDLDDALSAVLGSVEDHDSGLGSLLMHMLSLAKAEAPAKRVVGCNLFARFCSVTQADFDDFKVDWIRQLVSLLDDRAPEVIDAAWEALDALVKTVEKDEMEGFVVPLRRTIESVGTPGVAVVGFSRPNGLKPLLPILLQGLLAGTGEQREYSAHALGDLVERTDPAAFKPYTIREFQIRLAEAKDRPCLTIFRPPNALPRYTEVVGPLIRVIGDRFPPPVKSAILSTLTVLLNRVQQFVKPFFPQLQRTFIKSLADASSLSVRNRGVTALGVLMQHQPRVDAVVTDLVNLATTESGEIRDSVVNGLAAVVFSGGKNLTSGPQAACVDLVSQAFSEHGREPYNLAISRLLAGLATHDPSSISFLVQSFLLGELPSTALSSIAMRELIDTAPRVLYEVDPSGTVEKVQKNAGSGMAPAIARPARDTLALFKERSPWCDDESLLASL
ncbi:BZ3500_MvSof-1268-A1-R1_Chr1-3g01573 [Microbotryum saponariae]|uniref:BZ3500_MvSof-1268-A1-R1_Chr1-3g01573 protein n=1 Tax=Microbotryum saponariae TaxID=289078 RepID=A0A2X0KE09_9BASI|nr:BZ3500_MvSof-1268-A1-R1_Chr1-3g01573 [Microbotryum saponariae]SCZ94067.1 BZ3501_MvSof-1269-A2-R1_Chr1-3g01175 [Microbotryum saponariae]